MHWRSMPSSGSRYVTSLRTKNLVVLLLFSIFLAGLSASLPHREKPRTWLANLWCVPVVISTLETLSDSGSGNVSWGGVNNSFRLPLYGKLLHRDGEKLPVPLKHPVEHLWLDGRGEFLLPRIARVVFLPIYASEWTPLSSQYTLHVVVWLSTWNRHKWSNCR